jgi:hypothetical protein
MALKTTQISRCLDKKLQIAGYEIPDLLAIFFLLSLLNFLFGRTDMKIVLVWLPTILLATVLRIGKRDKPDNYLIHLVRFHLRRKQLFAFNEPAEWPLPPTKHTRGAR